jgi:predicted translin family RNA/ssDNA-binding protein
MEEIFSTIGKLYLDLLQSQKIIEGLQKKVDSLEKDLSNLQASIILREDQV